MRTRTRPPVEATLRHGRWLANTQDQWWAARARTDATQRVPPVSEPSRLTHMAAKLLFQAAAQQGKPAFQGGQLLPHALAGRLDRERARGREGRELQDIELLQEAKAE